MITIKKGGAPQSLIRQRREGCRRYEDLPTEVKEDIRKSLLKEQDGLCAYCMKRIPEKVKPGTGKNPKGMKIEHIIPRSLDHTKELDYINMVGVCCGYTETENNSSKLTHCDSSRKEKTTLNLNPFDPRVENSISYTATGAINSSNHDWHADITDEDSLNLNHPSLKAARQAVIDGLIKEMNKTSWSKLQLERKLAAINSYSPKKPYLGVYRYYISRKISKK